MKNAANYYYQCNFKAMGTLCEVQLFATSYNRAKQAADSVIADVQRLESLYSRYQPNSFLSKINQVAAVGGKIAVDPETASLLNYAESCYELSQGLFDISSGLLRKAWKFDQSKLPDQNIIEPLLKLVGWEKIIWKNSELKFTVVGMEIDFGGIVKEYAADRAASLCKEQGINHGIINLGGDIKVIGPRADNSPWSVGIKHPDQNQSLLKTIHMYEGGLASSGDYERAIIINGVRYGHILNPKTGWPVNYLSAVSVIADFCVIAGSASTIAMLKEKQGISWLTSLNLPYIWVDNNNKQGESLSL